MSDLAAHIVKKNQNVPLTSAPEQYDEFGLRVPVPETVEYLVARALLLHYNPKRSPYTVYQLHLRGGSIYFGHERIRETQDAIYDLTQIKRTLKGWEISLFWSTLRRYLPRLSKRIIEICPGLYWDTYTTSLLSQEEVSRLYNHSEV